jgi:hypothetical protein
MGGLARVGRGHRREPRRFIPASASSEMRQLDHHRCAVGVTGVGEFSKPGNDFILVSEYVIEYGGTVARHGSGSRRLSLNERITQQ